jgi:NTP pyrophosphatase (non-canonical NTP hydrolase)
MSDRVPPPAWVTENHRLWLCVWRARFILRGDDVPSKQADLLFATSSLGGEVAELIEAIQSRAARMRDQGRVEFYADTDGLKEEARELSGEAADCAIYAAIAGCLIGLPGEAVQEEDDDGDGDYPAPSGLEAMLACGRLQNAAKKLFRDGGWTEKLDLADCVGWLRTVVAFASGAARFDGDDLASAVGRKWLELRGRPNFARAFELYDDPSWTEERLAARPGAPGA